MASMVRNLVVNIYMTIGLIFRICKMALESFMINHKTLQLNDHSRDHQIVETLEDLVSLIRTILILRIIAAEENHLVLGLRAGHGLNIPTGEKVTTMVTWNIGHHMKGKWGWRAFGKIHCTTIILTITSNNTI